MTKDIICQKEVDLSFYWNPKKNEIDICSRFDLFVGGVPKQMKELGPWFQAWFIFWLYIFEKF